MKILINIFGSTFRYKVLTEKNTLETGEVAALMRSDVHRKLTRSGKTVILISKAKKRRNVLHLHVFGSRMRASDKVLFFRNLAMMTVANVPFAVSLEVIADQMRSRAVKNVIQKISREVTNGKSFAEAMMKFPKYFSTFLIESVRVGELTGSLSRTLERIADNIEKDQETKRRIKSVIAYPVIVMVFMIIVLVGVTVFVLPQIAAIYSDLGAPLPAITRVVLDASTYVMQHPITVVGVILAFLSLIVLFYRTKQGHYLVHAFILRLPIFGDLAKQADLARFFRAIKSLIGSGVSVVDAVEISRKTLKNDVYKRSLEKVRPILNHGIPLSEILSHHPKLFPMTVQRTVEVGEQAGKFTEAFEHLTLHYDRSLRHKIQMLSTLIEPVLMLLIGFVVGALALMTFLPIYRIASFI